MPPQPAPDPDLPPPPKIHFPFAVKKDLMLGEKKWGCSDLAFVPLPKIQETYMHLEEMIDPRALFFTYWQNYSKRSLPICYALGERDWLWEGPKETVEEFMASFPSVQDLTEALFKTHRIR
jgi:hypothetical protein